MKGYLLFSLDPPILFQYQVADFSGTCEAAFFQLIRGLIKRVFKCIFHFFRCRDTQRLCKIFLMKPIWHGKLPNHFGVVRHYPVIAGRGKQDFFITSFSDEETTVLELKERVHRNLSELNQKSDAPCPVSVSIGIAKASKDKSLKALISDADELLYQEKKRR